MDRVALEDAIAELGNVGDSHVDSTMIKQCRPSDLSLSLLQRVIHGVESQHSFNFSLFFIDVHLFEYLFMCV